MKGQSNPNGAAKTYSHEQIAERVVACVARTTRFPKEILVPTADLANDLGIDSVKQVEIIAALGKEFGVELPAERDRAVRTLEEATAWVASLLGSSAPTFENAPPPPTEHAPPPAIALVPASPKPATPPKPRPSKPSPSTGPLDGRVALITGSGRGIGRVIAEVLASQGATVLLNSFHSREAGEAAVRELEANGADATHLWGSVAKQEHVDAMFDEISRRFGYLDILVCNASDGRVGSFADVDRGDWDRAFRTNVSGHHHCAMRAAPLMQARGGGAIATLSAIGAHQYVSGLGCQGVVKAAVESLTRYLACELAPYGVRTNCVAAGPIYGELLDKLPEADASQRHWESMTPGGSLCSPHDVARTIAFLVSDGARAINGAVWNVDRGFSAHADSRLQPHGLPANSLAVLGK